MVSVGAQGNEIRALEGAAVKGSSCLAACQVLKVGRVRLRANAWEQERSWRRAEKACQEAPRAQRAQVP